MPGFKTHQLKLLLSSFPQVLTSFRVACVEFSFSIEYQIMDFDILLATKIRDLVIKFLFKTVTRGAT